MLGSIIHSLYYFIIKFKLLTKASYLIGFKCDWKHSVDFNILVRKMLELFVTYKKIPFSIIDFFVLYFRKPFNKCRSISKYIDLCPHLSMYIVCKLRFQSINIFLINKEIDKISFIFINMSKIWNVWIGFCKVEISIQQLNIKQCLSLT